MIPITLSQFDRRITLQRKTVASDPATNAEQVTWPDVATVWACVMESVISPNAIGPAAADIDSYDRPSELVIHWRADFDKSTMRVKYGTRTLRIVASAEVGRKHYIKMACAEWAHG